MRLANLPFRDTASRPVPAQDSKMDLPFIWCGGFDSMSKEEHPMGAPLRHFKKNNQDSCRWCRSFRRCMRFVALIEFQVYPISLGGICLRTFIRPHRHRKWGSRPIYLLNGLAISVVGIHIQIWHCSEIRACLRRSLEPYIESTIVSNLVAVPLEFHWGWLHVCRMNGGLRG